MKKVLSVLLSIILITALFPAGIFTITASAWGKWGGFTYRVIANNEAEIAQYDTSWFTTSKPFTIPAVINGHPVTKICGSAFENFKTPTSITIPDGVTYIGTDAFKSCTGITSVNIPESTTNISSNAFALCSNLETVIFNAKECSYMSTQTATPVFEDCPKLKKVIIGESVSIIPTNGFYGCDTIFDVYYNGTIEQKNNIIFESGNEILISAQWHFLKCEKEGHSYDNNICNVCGIVRCATHTWNKEQFFDSNVHWRKCSVCGEKKEAPERHIYENTCDTTCNVCANTRVITHTYDNSYDKYCNVCNVRCEISTGTTGDCTWVLDGTVLTISGGNHMDNYSYNSVLPWGKDITDVIIDGTLYGIGSYAFVNCTKLEKVTICNGVNWIGERSFYGCSNLKEIILSDNLVEIGAYAFYKTNIEKFELPSTLCTIGEGTFRESNVKEIFIPKNVDTISQYAFYGCKFLNHIWYSGTKTNKNNIKILGDNEPLINAEWHFICNLHTYSSECDEVCNVCELPREVNIAHSFSDVLSTKCNVCEHTRELESISVSAPPTKLYYLQGTENVNVSGGLTLLYSDGTTSVADITADMVTGFDSTELGEKTLTVNFGGKITTATIYIVEILPGDINEDNEVNVVDLALLKKMVAGLEESLDIDLNNDGETNVVDLAILKKMVAGLE